MEETDFHQLASDLIMEFGGMHARISRLMDRTLSGKTAVMRALMLAGGTLTPSELADRAWVSSARIANILRALEQKGWIVREHSKTDRRRVNVSVTDKGREGIENNRQKFEKLTASFLEQLGAEDTQELVRLLRRTNQIIDTNHPRKESKGHENHQAL